jgi:hypothetical protein
MSVATLAKILITLPVTGAVLDVRTILVWDPDVARLLTRVAQLVAVTTPPVLTAEIAVCPHPESVAPVPQIALRLV